MTDLGLNLDILHTAVGTEGLFIACESWVSIICLEDSTERSESNPGRSLGITNMK